MKNLNEIYDFISASYDVGVAKKLGISAAVLLNKLIYLHKYTQREDGYCWRKAEDLENELGIGRKALKGAIKKLKEAGIIDAKITYIKGTLTRCTHFKILVKIENSESTKGDISEDDKGSISEESAKGNISEDDQSAISICNNNKSNNKNNNNRSNNIYGEKENSSPKKFNKPSIEEIAAYCSERGNDIDPETFYYYYEATGWKIGKTPMKSWKSAVITWEKKKEKKSAQKERKVELNAELAELKDIFCDYYKEKVGMTYNWGERESVSLIELAEKIRDEINGTDLKMNFEAVLFRLPDWYKQNGLDINIINKNFNNIKNKIKNGESTDYDYLMRKYSAGLQS